MLYLFHIIPGPADCCVESVCCCSPMCSDTWSQIHLTVWTAAEWGAYSVMDWACTIARMNIGSKGIRPMQDNPFCAAKISILRDRFGLRSNLLMQTKAVTLKCAANLATRSISWSPETVGSAKIRTALAPPIAAMTGQPIPGGPSVRIRSRFFSSPIFLLH